MNAEQRFKLVDEQVEYAQAKLRTIRTMAKGKTIMSYHVAPYHFEELNEIIESLHHNVEQLNKGE